MFHLIIYIPAYDEEWDETAEVQSEPEVEDDDCSLWLLRYKQSLFIPLYDIYQL